ncbi:MAG: hypothetical protein Tsb0034_27220 [Ekhidna sp.]
MVKGILFKDGKFSKANIARFLGSNLLVSISVYCGLYLAFFGIPGSRTNFFAYLFVTIAVVSIENLAYILYSHLKTLKQEVSKASITIPMRNREQTLASTDIAMVEINNGIVRFHLNNQQVLISDFKTIDEVEQKLPVDSFFRTSRQVLINRKHVHELKKEPNRTLTLSLDFTASNLTVSRYKRKAFLDWYRNS